VEDVQTAIWKLIETTSFIADGADLDRTDYLFSRALDHIDFTPECGDLVGIVLLPVDEVGVYNKKQIALITYPLPCECGDETAWAAGSAFPGDSWAMYFRYCVKN
jgi:hypothetical protein